MRIAVMGTGGVGGYFGAHLAAAGLDVSFVARGRHLAAIRAEGLRLASPRGDLHVHPAPASDDPADIGPVDVVLFATKLWDVEGAGEMCRPLLKNGTAVISLLNGIDSEARLLPILGPAHVVGGVAYISATIEAPGLIRHFAMSPAIAFGELDGRPSPRLKAFQKAAAGAGIDARYSEDIQGLIWAKFIFLASMAGVTALTRQPVGPIREDPDMRRLLRDAVAEAVAVADAHGIAHGSETTGIMNMFDGLVPTTKSSMSMDLEKGNRLEVEWLSGAVVKAGETAGVATPVHRVIAAALKPFAMGALAPEKGGPSP
jgi:2-dehydropantoate 2-reductase